MVKVQIKSEKFTPLGGFFSIMKLFGITTVPLKWTNRSLN